MQHDRRQLVFGEENERFPPGKYCITLVASGISTGQPGIILLALRTFHSLVKVA